MVGLNSRAYALLLSVSVVALTTAPASAQTATGSSTSSAQTQVKRDRAARTAQPAAPAADPRNANAQAGSSTQSLDAITVVATKNEEKAIDALAPASAITLQQIQQFPPSRLQDVFVATPGVSFQDRGDEPSTSINIRGLQDFGRVAVVVDGARQNYQRSGHGAQGSFFLDPELIGGIDIVRGPSANIYGSGAIGGVVSFRTKDIDDVVRAGERWGVDLSGSYGSNNARGLGSVFGGVRVDPSVDVFGGAVYRTQGNYKDGAGTEIGNTGNDLAAGLMKFTVRPADGHEVKIGGIFQDFNYDVGQFNRGPSQQALYQGSSVYSTSLQNYTGTLSWKYSQPDDTWFDWSVNLYGNRTNSDQTKTYHYSTSGSGYCGAGNYGNNISGCIGDKRGYNLDTIGIDANNTSRFEYGNWRTAVTYGVDVFNDKVTTWDSRGNSNITTPGGERTVSGGFIQVKNNYAQWLEVIGAARYDHYELNSNSSTASGSRLSPKVTLGLTPIAGFTPYVAYAEGYRAPSITETLIAGAHATGGGPALFTCADGTSGLFCLIPNTALRPEVGKNKEVGINLKYNDVFISGDSFRGKINAFRNDVDNYIELLGSTPQAYRTVFMGFPVSGVASKYYQYQNIPHARIEGVEVETSYDAGMWFVGVSAAVIRGTNPDTGLGLVSVPARKVVTTGGLRLLDRQLTIAAQWASYAANTNLPTGYLPGTSYDLVNLNIAYRPTADVTLNFSIDNLLNNYYRPYAIPGSSSDGTTQNDILWTSPGPGVVYKGGIKVHFGGA
ncbi:TonB-dependent heme/hemoglobin receptor family protein [Rhodopseudomonas palustris TIE-1]|uniref:TonB-dependent hemoglobin/transferrin/lactoferrin family receptor n=1 Tax=Rhodopseudomonas palustris TaxID=1076 RepID=UPI000164A8DF|nr:TonB-dependent hemoglobin/transferrin/lactoferrin family receptor [Rhodopseudomonas palustris]ACF00929.1 TonB-dependent heme/hemoglobin receptor family protein [Rhodopseudomonas palustris TIE-1]